MNYDEGCRCLGCMRAKIEELENVEHDKKILNAYASNPEVCARDLQSVAHWLKSKVDFVHGGQENGSEPASEFDSDLDNVAGQIMTISRAILAAAVKKSCCFRHEMRCSDCPYTPGA